MSYADFIASESDFSGRRKVGKATVFVSHVWKMTAKDFFEVCLAVDPRAISAVCLWYLGLF